MNKPIKIFITLKGKKGYIYKRRIYNAISLDLSRSFCTYMRSSKARVEGLEQKGQGWGVASRGAATPGLRGCSKARVEGLHPEFIRELKLWCVARSWVQMWEFIIRLWFWKYQILLHIEIAKVNVFTLMPYKNQLVTLFLTYFYFNSILKRNHYFLYM